MERKNQYLIIVILLCIILRINEIAGGQKRVLRHIMEYFGYTIFVDTQESGAHKFTKLQCIKISVIIFCLVCTFFYITITLTTRSECLNYNYFSSSLYTPQIIKICYLCHIQLLNTVLIFLYTRKISLTY